MVLWNHCCLALLCCNNSNSKFADTRNSLTAPTDKHQHTCVFHPIHQRVCQKPHASSAQRKAAKYDPLSGFWTHARGQGIDSGQRDCKVATRRANTAQGHPPVAEHETHLLHWQGDKKPPACPPSERVYAGDDHVSSSIPAPSKCEARHTMNWQTTPTHIQHTFTRRRI